MSRHRSCWVSCDACGENSNYQEGFDRAAEAAYDARKQGWSLGLKRNGRRVDLCEDCKREGKHGSTPIGGES